MTRRHDLLKRLKSLTSIQFDELIFILEIDTAIISGSNAAMSNRAMEVIKILEQDPNG